MRNGAGAPTPRDLIAEAARRFEAAGLFYGHGTDNAWDEAAFLVLHGLGLPPDADEALLDTPVTTGVEQAEALVAARIARRCPAAYLTGRMWFAGHEFEVLAAERVRLAGREVGEGHSMQAADAGVHLMHFGRESVRRQPLDDRIGIHERAVDALGWATENSMKLDCAHDFLGSRM